MRMNRSAAQRACAPLLGLAFAVLATGCGVLQPRAVIASLGSESDHHVITKTAALTTTMVVPRDTRYFLCASPPPDAVFTQAETVGLNINVLNFGKGTDDSASESSTEEGMMGRTPAVVLTRELLYRFCEFQLNQRLTREQAIDLYRQNLSIIRDIALQEGANTRVTIGESQAVNSDESAATTSAPKPRATGVRPPATDTGSVNPPSTAGGTLPQGASGIPMEVVRP